MPEPFKNLLSPPQVHWLAEQILAAWPAFDAHTFEQKATAPLEALELKARVAHIAATLGQALPSDWSTTLDILLRALPEPLPSDTDVGKSFRLWPMLHLVQTAGLHDPERSVPALKEMTKRFTAEFAVRPFLIEHPELTWSLLESYTRDPDLHMRRWLSEGTRPRLPWGIQLRDSVADPSRGLALIEALIDDPELYVRRSVSNHLNDVSKDHPELTVTTARRWAEAVPHRKRLVSHGLRTLVKRGDSGALDILGFGAPEASLESLWVEPAPLALGERGRLHATLRADTTQAWMVDWVVYAPRANQTLGRRVLKGSKREVHAGEEVNVSQVLSLAPVTTRVQRPGTWRIGIQVNGVELGTCTLEVRDG